MLDQISLPVRIMLIATAAFAVLWVAALRPKPAEDSVPAPAVSEQPVKPADKAPAKAPADTPPAGAPDPVQQAADEVKGLGPVQRAIARNRVAVLTIWDPRADEDRAVRDAVRGLARPGVTVIVTTPAHLARYGRITRAVQILQTPTVVVVDRARNARAITGFQDRAVFEQAVADALAVKAP